MKSIKTYIAGMVQEFLTDEELLGEKKAQIEKALDINFNNTSTWGLQVAEVQDILGRDSSESGWYITLEGARCGVKFFVNNDLEIVRKPNNNKVKVAATYSLYNDNHFSENFWYENF